MDLETYHLSSAVYWVFRHDIIICRFTIINTVLLTLILYHVGNGKRKQTAIARLEERAIDSMADFSEAGQVAFHHGRNSD